MAIGRFWTRGEEIRAIEVGVPVLASWMKSTHPDQIRLTAYLEDVKARLSPLPAGLRPLFLEMEVAVSDRRELLSHHDLENYLTPLFGRRWLDPSRFAFVAATKRVGGANRIRLGYADGPVEQDLPEWGSFQTHLDTGLTSASCKRALRERIQRDTSLLPEGPVAVRMAWRCSSRRNWTSLWKPTGDTMGPILGVTRSAGFNPKDDRIVALELHREVDDRLGNALQLGI